MSEKDGISKWCVSNNLTTFLPCLWGIFLKTFMKAIAGNKQNTANFKSGTLLEQFL